MIYHAGLDIGSTTTKCIIISENGSIASKEITNTTALPKESTEYVLQKCLKQINLKKSNLTSIIATGYGRRGIESTKHNITEIAAVGRGSFILNNCKSAIIIDIGGQDTKIIDTNSNGNVTDFLMNDKCAAGTGRFIEIMARIIDQNIDNLSSLAEKSSKKIILNSTCSVFAESEIISLIAKSTAKKDIAASLFYSISQKITNMLNAFNYKNREILFCGGGANFGYLKYCLEKSLNKKITTLANPQFVAAFGAASYKKLTK